MKKHSARGTMTRESVADAALAIADRDGFESVTIRAVAVAVRATPMALYTYFRDKDALFSGMRERVFAKVSASGLSRSSWQAMLRTCVDAMFRVLRGHPNWTPLLAHSGEPPESALGFLDELLQLMLADGLAVEDAVRAYAGVMSFALGSVLFERLLIGEGNAVSKRVARLKQVVASAPVKYRTLSAVAAKVDRWSFEEVFQHGLDSLIGGVETSGGRPKARRRRI
jgi:AcrR family transcriptional regulator